MYPEESKTRRDLKIIGCLVLVAVLIPICALLVPLRPPSESLGSWFQRSGSVMTVLCLALDVKIFSIHGRLFPSGYVSLGFGAFKEKYLPVYNALSVVLLILTAVGTVIWGYGDLLVCI